MTSAQRKLFCLHKSSWFLFMEMGIHYENKSTKTFRLIDILHSLNFSLEFFIMMFFVTNQLNISEFLPPRIRKTSISYYLTDLVDFLS